MSEEDKSSNRTFGLVSGYDSNMESEEVTKKQKVDKGEKEVTEDKNEDEEEMPETKAPSLSWMRAKKEYEERSMKYSFICSGEDDEEQTDKTNEPNVEVNGGEK